jgi:hypothetical protein
MTVAHASLLAHEAWLGNWFAPCDGKEREGGGGGGGGRERGGGVLACFGVIGLFWGMRAAVEHPIPCECLP